MHPEALAYVKRHAPDAPGDVAEVGSYDVNGSPRGLFSAATFYTGYDIRAGRGVDEVRDVAQWRAAPRFDTVVSTETLEHAKNAEALLAGMARMLRPGGLLILTAAAPERTPHGNNGGAVGAGEHYAGVDPADLRRWLREAGLTVVDLEHHAKRGDVYATARKAKAEPKKDGGEA
jgi:cyclopropane fatty-acyl-phospholipid synthase-like methyltransferase